MMSLQNGSTGPTTNGQNGEGETDPILKSLDIAEQELARIQAEGPKGEDRKQYELRHFFYDTIQDKYWCDVDLRLRSAESVDGLVPMSNWVEAHDANGKFKLQKPSQWLRRIENEHIVEGSTWWPGRERIINDVIVTEEGVLDVTGARCFNTYRAPRDLEGGDPERGKAWGAFVEELFGAEAAEFMVNYFAHLVQRPHEKCNAIIAMTGDQGIGKDTTLEAIRNIVGTWNCKEISPDMVFEAFDPWKQALLLVINEARPQNTEHMQWQFYEKLKVLGAAPPHWLHVNAKFERLKYVRNTMRTVITFNKIESLYVPDDDRRIYIARAIKDPGWLSLAARNAIHKLVNEDVHHVAAFLRSVDLSRFDPYAPPPRSDGWQSISSAWNEREGDELFEALAELNHPPAIFSNELITRTNIGAGLDTRTDLMKRVKSPHFVGAMERLGYRLVTRPASAGKDWRFGKSGSSHCFRSRSAFVRRDLFSPDMAVNQEHIMRHGRALAKEGEGE